LVELSLAASLEESASPEQNRYLDVCQAAAAQLEMPLYLVGGAIRDLLLTGKTLDLDIDLVVEGDALALGEVVAQELGVRPRAHRRFLTAEIELGDTHIDLVTARRERYDEPASLPRVEPGELEDDLARRDFTVNAMALRLWPPGDEQVVDPWGGREDLAKRRLRVLYDRSFFDDPTRILRGARIGARLNLEFDTRTANLAAEAIAVGAFDPLSGTRLRHELILLLEDEQVELSLKRLAELGFLPVLNLPRKWTESDWTPLRSVLKLREKGLPGAADDLEPHWWLALLMSLCARDPRSEREQLARRLDLDGELRRTLVDFAERTERAVAVMEAPDATPHEVCVMLDALAPEELVVVMATGSDEVIRWVDRWLTELRDLRLAIDGDDLRAVGFAESPQLGRALEETLTARQNGSIDVSQELEFAVETMRKESE